MHHPDTQDLPAVYTLYVLGSGGHTAEMCEMIKSTFRGLPSCHRRYLFTSGDTGSLIALKKLEDKIHTAYSFGTRVGTFDCFQIPRARRVHQPFYTAPFTTVQSAMHIVNLLTCKPERRASDDGGDAFQYPHVIVTNGPGTGFVVCVVALALKFSGLAPRDRLKIVYVESWARSETLSLTGKLFHLTKLADLFLVQQRSLAKIYSKQYIGVFEQFAPTTA
jgi:beta-1,4-N-acetylglucosaminyltransferase